MQIALIGIQTNSSGTADGVMNAPLVLRETGLVDRLNKHADVEDYGDFQFLASSSTRDQKSGIIAPGTLVSMIQGTTKIITQALSKQQFPLVVGGDCPILLGCLQALRNTSNKFGLMFLDGHEDAYPPLKSPTGEAADMELSIALGLLGEAVLPDYLKSNLPLLDPKQLTLLGPRDKPIINHDGIESLPDYFEFLDDKSITSSNVTAIGQQCFSRQIERNKNVWLHLDLDVLSSEVLPSVDYRQPGGLSWNQLENLTAAFFKKDLLLGWDITIYNPDLDPERRDARRIVEFIETRIALLNE